MNYKFCENNNADFISCCTALHVTSKLKKMILSMNVKNVLSFISCPLTSIVVLVDYMFALLKVLICTYYQ